MVDSADIDNVSKIDFTKGFQHFHVQWPLNNLFGSKRSSTFKTKVLCGDQCLVLSWSLGIRKQSEDPTKTWFGASLETSDKITPMIYRVSLSSSGNVLFDRSYLVIMDDALDYGHDISTSEVDKFVNDGNLVLNYYIDIPKAVALGDNSRKRKLCSSESTENITEFMLDAAKMFTRVLGSEADPTSDVAVIIIDKQEKELRRFNCHSIFLVARSSVFGRMFGSDKWEETCTKNDRSVKIDDISEQVMETVLRFIYTSDLPDTSTESAYLFDVIYAADKYNLELLKKRCVSCLIYQHDDFDVSTRYEQLMLADRHNLIQLKSVCLAQFSMCFPMGYSDHGTVKDTRSDFWSEIVKAVSERQARTTYIVLPAE